MLQPGPLRSGQPRCQTLRILLLLLLGLAATTNQRCLRAQPIPCASYDATGAASALSALALAPTGYQLASAPHGLSASHLTRRCSYRWPAPLPPHGHQPTPAYQLPPRPPQPRCQPPRRLLMDRRTRPTGTHRILQQQRLQPPRRFQMGRCTRRNGIHRHLLSTPTRKTRSAPSSTAPT